MVHGTRGSDLSGARRGARALGSPQPDPWVQRCPRVGLAGVAGGSERCPAEPAALVARRGRVSAPVHLRVERPVLLRQAGAGAALAGSGLTWGAGGGGRPGRDILSAGCGGQRPGPGAAGGDPSAGSAGRPGGRFVAAGQRRLRCGVLAAGVEGAAVRAGLGEALHAGSALQHDAAGAGDGSPADVQRACRSRRRCSPVPERRCPAPGDDLGVALARWRDGRCPLTGPHRADAGRAGRPDLGHAARAPRASRCGRQCRSGGRP